MTCPFALDDAAYVLGALSPTDRLEFERHLSGCHECTRAVGELAGLPGLLGRVDASLLEHLPAVEPVPATLLPALSRAVRRGRRRRAFASAGLAAAAVALIVPVVVAQVEGNDGADPVTAGPSSTPSGVASRAMEPVGDVPVQARVSLEQVTWGTRLGLTCSYDPDATGYELPATVDYALFVRTRDGRVERVGSWRSVGGRTMRLTAATAVRRDDIRSVEVRTPEGRVVLKLAL